MNLQTFRAPTMAECLAEVKRVMGPDAVILHTRSYKEGGMMGLGARRDCARGEAARTDGTRARAPPRSEL